jgi:hypothetical protein
VGIGKSNSSAYTLDVSGNANFSGNVFGPTGIFNNVTVNQNETIGGTLQVTNTSTLRGNVGIGKDPTSNYALDISGNVNVVYGTVTAPTFNSTSDYRIKEHIESLSLIYATDTLNPVSYYNKQLGKQDIGLIAHEVQEIFPMLVQGEKDGEQMQSINYLGLIPILIKEIQELKKEVNVLKREVSELKEKGFNNIK